MHNHHIVFESHGGLTFPLNIIRLTLEQHEGNNSPHHNKQIDDGLKRNLQKNLFNIFTEEGYTIEQIAKALGRTTKYFEKEFRKVPSKAGIYKPKDIVFKLMGGKFYYE